jgi:hypothetical protein
MSERARTAIQELAIGDFITFYINRKRVDSPPKDTTQKVQQIRGIAQVRGEAFESNDLVPF